jgi:hypothetical protein
MDPELLTKRVRDALQGHPVTAKRMFGGLAFLLAGNMLCCVSAKGLMVRIGADAEPAAFKKRHAAPCLGAGRRMAGFIMVAPLGLKTDAALSGWLDMALAYVGTLPSKTAKPAGNLPPASRQTAKRRR